jgi:hypothetical protein
LYYGHVLSGCGSRRCSRCATRGCGGGAPGELQMLVVVVVVVVVVR